MNWTELPIVCVLAAPVFAAAQDPEAGADANVAVRPVGSSEVTVSAFGTVDIVAQNDYVTNILQKLAIQARRNIVPSGQVDRLVSANIYGVPFDDALDALLTPNGLGSVTRGEFVFVHTQEELAELGVGAITRAIHLNYIRAADAERFALPMLSPTGEIAITEDFPESEEGRDGGSDATGSASAGSSVNTGEIYSPNTDEYDLRNAIVVRDTPERVEQIAAFLDSMDVRPTQIRIEATIIQTSLTEQNAFGIDFALMGGEDFLDFFQPATNGRSLSFIDNPAVYDNDGALIPGTGEGISSPAEGSPFAISTPGNAGAGDATLRVGFVDDIGVFLRALDQVSDVTLLSNPKVTTLNRQRTRVFVGTKVSYLESSIVDQVTIQTLKFLDTGIALDVRPFILEDGQVRLELSPKVSTAEFRQVVGPTGGTQEIPDEKIQTVTTDILVPAGHTAVLGGLFREDMARVRNQVPLLGDLPVIGALFQGREDDLRQVELIFLIKPVLLEPEEVIAEGALAEEYYHDVRVGSRLGLLYWSRERQSARLNLEAQRHIQDGEVKKARYKLSRSLGMFPAQPDVIRALERLYDEELWIRDLNYINEVIDAEYERVHAAGDDE